MLIANNQNNKNKQSKNKKSKKLKDEVSTIGFKENLDPKKVRKMKLSSQNWLRRQLNDVYVKAAKKEGYYSRSAYKLQELNQKFHFLKTGMKVIDLGAAPGGWSQVVAQHIFRKYKKHSHNLQENNSLHRLDLQSVELAKETKGTSTSYSVQNTATGNTHIGTTKEENLVLNDTTYDIENLNTQDISVIRPSTSSSSVYTSTDKMKDLNSSNTHKPNTTTVLHNQNVEDDPKLGSIEENIFEEKVSKNNLDTPNNTNLSKINFHNTIVQDVNIQGTSTTNLEVSNLDTKTETSQDLLGNKHLEDQKDGSLLISLDLLPINFIENAITLQGDFTDTTVMNHIREILAGSKVDVILSDMAPNTLGIQAVDHLRIMNLVEMAYDFALEILEKNGTFVAKVFQGGTTGELLHRVKSDFRQINHYKPEATRKESNEIYLIARKYKGKLTS